VVLSVDYVRSRGVHFYIRRDANRRFAADTFVRATAADRIARTLRAFGVATIDEALAQGATIASFGLTSAFPGMVRGFSNVFEMQTSGLSTYNALQVKLDGRLTNVSSFIKNMYVGIPYSLGGAKQAAVAHLHLASLYDQQGKYSAAADELEAYLRDVPNPKNADKIRQVIKRLRQKKSS
jgi:hypothetical protein